MRHLSFIFAGAALWIATSAQCQSSSTPGNPPPQNSAAGSPAAPASAEPPPVAPPVKKVWTNDDVGDLRADSTISTVGSTGTQTARKSTASAKPKNQQQFQAQIARLEGQIPALDKQIAELQDAIDGKPTGDAKSSQRPRSVKADDWNVQMQDLQKKKQDVLDHIAALKDEARHQGVAPNTLP
jgi:hypothetical protein